MPVPLHSETKLDKVMPLTTEQKVMLKAVGLRLEEAITSLIREKPVFGFILTRMRRVQAGHLCPTMGVRPTEDKFIQLQYNPEFVGVPGQTQRSLTDEQLEAVLEHEVMHIINEHPMRRNSRDPLRWNLAADIAINQYIKGLPEDCLKVPEGLEKEREAEYYYKSEQVEQMAQQMQGRGQCKCDKCGGSGKQPCGNCDGKGCGSCGGSGEEKCDKCGGSGHNNQGDHSGWEEMDGDVSCQDKVRQMVKGAVEDAKRQGRGTMPGWMEEMIARIMAPPIKWNILLRSGISEEVSPMPEETFRRCHRRRQYEVNGRMEDIYPGFKRKPQSRLICAIDTSGSMGAEELGEIVNELAFLSRAGYYPIKLIHCDTQITKIETYNGKNEIVCHGRGGTTFTPVLDYMRDEEPAAEGLRPTLVFFTDGQGDNPPDNGYTKRFKTIWVVSRNGSSGNVAQFGTIIQMEKHRRA